MKRQWCSLLEISTNVLLLPKELGLLQQSILQYVYSLGFQKLLPHGKQNGLAFLGRPGFKGFLQHTYQTRLLRTHEANYSLSTGLWKQQVLVLTSLDAGYISAQVIPKVSHSGQNKSNQFRCHSLEQESANSASELCKHFTGCLMTFYRHTEIPTSMLETYFQISSQMSRWWIFSGGFSKKV